MAERTPNLNLIKPDQADFYDVAEFNENADLLDAAVTEVKQAADGAIPTTEKGEPGGVASLDATGKVPSVQLPAMDYIPTSQKGTSGGVASLDSAGKLPTTQLPVVPVAQGGTGAASAEAARTNLGVPPIGHASTGTAYGAASATNYGHAKASAATPLMDGTAAVGTDNGLFAREGHRHPTDTTRAPLASPAFTGTPTAPTQAAGNNSTRLATTAFVAAAVAAVDLSSYYLKPTNTNVVLGVDAGTSTTGSDNVLVGHSSGKATTSGSRNTYIGSNAGVRATGSDNIAIGYNAGITNAQSGNIAIGSNSGSAYNSISIAIGAYSANSASSTEGISIGYSAGTYLGGQGNIAIGRSAGDKTSTGTNANASGTRSVFIGYDNRSSASGSTNEIVIGSTVGTSYCVGGGSNTITLGNAQITRLRCQVTSITALSDERLKRNIEVADTQKLIDALMAIPVKRYEFDETVNAGPDKHRLGFVAQDVQKVFPKSVDVGVSDILEPVLDKAGKAVYKTVQQELSRLPVTDIAQEEVQTLKLAARSRSMLAVSDTLDTATHEGARISRKLEVVDGEEFVVEVEEREEIETRVKVEAPLELTQDFAIPVLWGVVQHLVRRVGELEGEIAQLKGGGIIKTPVDTIRS